MSEGRVRLGAALAAALLLLPGAALAQSAYGTGWYRGEFWSGEYPNGFTMTKDATMQLRPELSADSKPSIDCLLPAKATYHPWNNARVNADGLTFVSFTETEPMVVKKAYDATLYADLDGAETPMSFKKGDKWTYLAYFGEGAFLMEYDGVRYSGDQGLQEVSESSKPGDKAYEEWLRINCSNHNWGWLFMGDIAGNDAFGPPNIAGYGDAKDAE